MKRNVLRAFLCGLSMICVSLAAAADPILIDGIYYELYDSDRHAKVTHGEEEYEGTYVIPETVSYNGTDYTVTTIGRRAFYDNNNVTSIRLPETIVKVEDEAFGWCRGLKEMNIPSGILEVGKGSFAYVKMPEVKIPEAITDIPERAFMGLGAKKITLPSKLKTIRKQGCYGWSEIEEISLPETLEDVYSEGLSGMSKIKKLHLPSKIYIGRDDYSRYVTGHLGGSFLEEITVDPANPYYTSYKGVLFNKDLSEALNFPNRYPHKAFVFPDECYSFRESCGGNETVEDLTLPNVRGEIMSGTRFKALKSIHFGAGARIRAEYVNYSFYVPQIVMSDFLETITVDPANEQMTVVDGVLYDKSCYRLYRYPANLPGSTFVLPESVKVLGLYSMRYLKNLRNFIIAHDGVRAEKYALWSKSFRVLDIQGLESSDEALSLGTDKFPAPAEDEWMTVYISDNLSMSKSSTLLVSNCTALNVVCTSVPYCRDEYSISYSPERNPDVKLYVPLGMKEEFENATGWEKFAGKIYEKDFSGITAVKGPDSLKITVDGGVVRVDGLSGQTTVDVFDIQGRLIASERGSETLEFACPPGNYIVKAGAAACKINIK